MASYLFYLGNAGNGLATGTTASTDAGGVGNARLNTGWVTGVAGNGRPALRITSTFTSTG
jgi:hypothetical protein